MPITNTMIEFLEARKDQDELLSLAAFKAQFGLTNEETLTVYDAWRYNNFAGHQCRYEE